MHDEFERPQGQFGYDNEDGAADQDSLTSVYLRSGTWISMIPVRARLQILRELDRTAINTSIVYPSLESLARHIAKPFPAD